MRGLVGRALTLDLRHQRRAFGANGFYGNSPSKEWTDQTLVSARWARSGDTGRRRPASPGAITATTSAGISPGRDLPRTAIA
ncbi:MAG: hypothetical protein IPL75_13910 [Acidobacteria bacterium]|nr:hypothetical protein [Acidobacteriota bacterium]